MSAKFYKGLSLFLLGVIVGIIVGVAVDADTVYQTTIKKLKQKNSPDAEMTVTAPAPPEKSRKDIRMEKKEDRQREREIRKTNRKKKRTTFITNPRPWRGGPGDSVVLYRSPVLLYRS